MRLQRDILPDQLLPAYQYSAAAVAGEKAIVKTAALSQAMPTVAAAQTRQHREIHCICVTRGASAEGSRMP